MLVKNEPFARSASPIGQRNNPASRQGWLASAASPALLGGDVKLFRLLATSGGTCASDRYGPTMDASV